ncbi:Tyrosine-protein phosphatase [Sesbania bispinosa]|nr:Tyrosine-protein phosphatase [Sesbania bispinosa]
MLRKSLFSSSHLLQRHGSYRIPFCLALDSHNMMLHCTFNLNYSGFKNCLLHLTLAFLSSIHLRCDSLFTCAYAASAVVIDYLSRNEPISRKGANEEGVTSKVEDDKAKIKCNILFGNP